MPIPRAAALLAPLFALAWLWAASSAVRAQDRSAAGTISFNRDVRPILANSCFTCHGPDEAQRETVFHFDTREGAFKEEGIIVPGDGARSDMIRRVGSRDPDFRMPPVDSGHGPLTDAADRHPHAMDR
jgi:hypothetical protein